MTVCIDTNVVLTGRQPLHANFPILNGVIAGRIAWAVSSSILLEYEEILRDKAGLEAWRKFNTLLSLLSATLGTLVRVSPSFQFNVIHGDLDDNKFTDCAITAHADYVITDDGHFAALADAGYKPQPITPEAFISKYRGIHV